MAILSKLSIRVSNSVTLTAGIGLFATRCLLDTGSTYSPISQQLLTTIKSNLKLIKSLHNVDVSTYKLQVHFNEKVTLHLKLRNLCWDFVFLLTTNIPHPIILGCDFPAQDQSHYRF